MNPKHTRHRPKLHHGAVPAAALGLSMLLVGCNSYHRQQAINAMEQKNWSTAEQHLQKVRSDDPADWKANYLLGKVRLEQGQPLDAQLLLEKSLTLRPAQEETGDIMDALAEALFRQRADAQLYAFLAESATQGGQVRDYLRQAQYLTKMGDVDEARVAYRKAVRFAGPTDPQPHIAMADFYESVGDRANAIMALRRAYTITPEDPKLAERFRGYGIVPGPTLWVAPEPDPVE